MGLHRRDGVTSKHLKLKNSVACLIAKQKDEQVDSWAPALKNRLVSGTSGPPVHLLLGWKHPRYPTAVSDTRQELQWWLTREGFHASLWGSPSHRLLCSSGEMPSTPSGQRASQRSQHTDLSQRLVNSLSLSCVIQTQSLAWGVTSADAVTCLVTASHCDKSRQ